MSMNAPEFTRLNDPNTHRNKYINFLSVLEEFDDHDEAMTKLCQLAAQVKPLMKHFGLRVNSLEEHEFNKEYSGINWNAGENVGLVLRGPSGRFHPLDYVLQVFHHELAHCQFMNHVPSQHGRLTAQLSKECKKLQQRGYFGDGFWSSGTNLKNEISKGDGLGSVISSRPKELCGGALSRKSKGRTPKKFTGYRKPRKGQLPGGGRSFKGPSLSSGAQTAANSKSAGNRMKKQLPGQGQRLDGNDHLQGASRANKLYTIDSNSTFGKSVKGQSHREKIAEAAERRMREERRRLERERRDEEENEYEELINERNQRERQRGRGGGFGNAIQIDSEDEEDDELDSEEEAERNQRIEEGVQVDSDLESEVDELISESEDEDDLPDAFQTIQGMKAKNARAKAKAKAKAKGKGKGKQTPRKSSTPSKKTQSQSRQTTSSSSSKTPKQLSEISRKAEGRNVGDTWNDVSLGSDDDGSFHYHSEDEEDFGDRFNTLRRDRDSEEDEDSDDDIFNTSRDNGRKKNRKSTSSASNGQGSSSRPSSSSSPIKRKASTSSIKKKVSFSNPEAQPEAKKPRNSSTLILPGRPDFQSKHASSSSSQTGKSQAPKSQAKKSQPGKAEIIDLISDEEDQDEDSGVNIAQVKPHFTSSAQEKRWNEHEALKADKEKREREEEMQKKRNPSSSSLASGSSNTISDSENQPRSNPKPRASGSSGSSEKRTMDLKWTCVICTLNNEWDASVCAGCDTTKGETMMGL